MGERPLLGMRTYFAGGTWYQEKNEPSLGYVGRRLEVKSQLYYICTSVFLGVWKGKEYYKTNFFYGSSKVAGQALLYGVQERHFSYEVIGQISYTNNISQISTIRPKGTSFLEFPSKIVICGWHFYSELTQNNLVHTTDTNIMTVRLNYKSIKIKMHIL
jgi:hypothetical protein